VTEEGRVGKPAPLPAALERHGQFSAGTFIASSRGSLSPTAKTPVAAPAGLEYSDEGSKKHSVRGVLWTNGALYVADQPAGRIKVYDREGKYLGQSNVVETPVHMVASGNKLFVSGANEIHHAELTRDPGSLLLKPVPGLHVKNGVGMAFSNSGNLYVASRTENKVLKFGPDFKPMPFACELPDNPEFLLHV
jgi:DNA-binding beta-propeller fold protein YncE